MLAIILFIFLSILIYIKINKIYRYWTEKGITQGKPTFLLGDLAGIVLRKESFYEVIMRLYNSIPNERYVGFYQTLLPTLLVKDIELIKRIGVKEFEHFVDHRQFVPEDVDPLWAKNLFALRGSKWKHMRTTLSPNFTSSKIKMMFNLISECAEEYLQFFVKTHGSQTVELKDIFTRYTNDVIASVAFGVKCDSMKHRTNQFYLMGIKATVFTFWRLLSIFAYTTLPKLCEVFRIRFIPRSVSNFFQNLIKETLKIREERGIIRQDMIHLLLEARKGRNVNDEQPKDDAGFATVEEVLKSDQSKKPYITDMDIAAQGLIFFFAGFETVSVLMSFMGYELALNPDIQKKLQEEVDDTAKNCKEKVTYEALVRMKYMDMVVTETLRKWPPVVLVDRVCTKSYTVEPVKADEKTIILQSGDVVWIPIYAIHHDAKFYPNPEKFDPERFSDDNKDQINPYTFLPFGLGPRNCIGSRMALLEVKTIFFYILQQFDFVATEKTEVPLKLCPTALNLLAQNGMWVDMKPRKL